MTNPIRRSPPGLDASRWLVLLSSLVLGSGCDSCAATFVRVEPPVDAALVDASMPSDAGEDAATDAFSADAGGDADEGSDSAVDAALALDAGVDADVDAGLACPGFGYSQPLTIPTGYYQQALVLGDVDEDGRPDIVVANSASTSPSMVAWVAITTVLNAGDRTFASPTHAPEISTPGRGDVDLVDLDRDGHLDVVTAAYQQMKLHTLTGAGDGSFVASAAIDPGDTSSTVPMRVAVGDLDGDGIADLVTGESSTYLLGSDGALGVFLGGAAGYGPRVRYPLVGTPGNPGGTYYRGANDVVLADLDEDGDLDVLAATSDAMLVVFPNHGDGTLEAPSYRAVGSSGTDGIAGHLAVGDLDGDGHLDVVTTDYWGPAISLFRGDGAGGFAPRATLDAMSFGWPSRIAAADFDGDGRLDLVARDGVRRQRPDGTFAAPLGFAASGTTTLDDFVVGDLDADGRADLVLLDKSNPNIYVYFSECP